ncbi:CobD/CbiB family cobalamin biosynthesis protein [Synechococcus sp. MW101C3]|uniref:CobD/CbiB family cobalamin biosynthesis protein n=1 Tax=Synechococcus sp. MW101C3 TaxID=210768 RepID=UPI001E3BDF3A|nr:CobD/CbiB family cobalamin biosynthesis protein [Synechococcus sp. MW101C3]
MSSSGAAAALLAWLTVAAACGLDRWLGDPAGWLHPVQVMGWWISVLRRSAEAWAGDRPGRLRLAGACITVLLVGGSAGAGWLLEALAWRQPALGLPLLWLGLTSCLAGASLEQAVRAAVAPLERHPAEAPPSPEALAEARARLAWIVGRDVDQLDEAGILRAAAETAAENSVDGLFAPLFWLLVGAGLWLTAGLMPPAAGLMVSADGLIVTGHTLAHGVPPVPGPLALGWAFKASSTLDSMLGYRRGRLRWLGTAGARLDDLLTWLPCRLVALTLPLLQAGRSQAVAQLRLALREGGPDPSPNAGVSQAAFAAAAHLRLGGANHYGGVRIDKPVLGAGWPAADQAGVERLLRLSRQLELLWLLVALPLLVLIAALRPR